MSVLECDRADCEQIMSERYSDEYGYLCYECFDELVALGPETNISNFMKTSKQPKREEAATARFEVEFPLRDR